MKAPELTGFGTASLPDPESRIPGPGRSGPSSPAAAIAWELGRRHRWGFLALGGYLVAIAAIKLVIVAGGRVVVFDEAWRFALVVVVPLTATFTYLLAVFTYGLSGDLAARRSMYPARMFTLPVSTAALAGWPMAYGSLAMSILWLATRVLAVWPADAEVPLAWPALLAAALLAWTQALTWMPYGLPGLRVIVAVLWLATIDTVVLLALHFRAHEAAIVAMLAPQVPLAYVVARFAVARARRGVVPDWSGAFARLARAFARHEPEGGHGELPFRTAARAQAWLEWRQHGRTLPALVAILLPFELALLWAARDAPVLVVAILLGVLITPPVMAAFVAATVRRAGAAMSDSYGLPPFVATRPLTGPALVAAKLRTTIRSTLAAWMLVVVAVPAALVLSDTWPVAAGRWRRMTEVMGAARATVLLLLVLAAFVASTWKQLVQTLHVGLTGRDWIVRSSVFVTLVLLSVLGPLAVWIAGRGAARAALWDALPWILAALVCVKLSAAAWVAVRLWRGRLLRDRTLVIGAACWCAAVLALHGALSWIVATAFFPHHLLALVAILAVPLARVSAAPLALDRNRHR